MNRKLLLLQRKFTQAGQLERSLFDIVRHLDVTTGVMKHYDVRGLLSLLLLYVQLHLAYLARTLLLSNSAKCYHHQFYNHVLPGTFVYITQVAPPYTLRPRSTSSSQLRFCPIVVCALW
jgi:hypothetical protein